MSIMTRELKVSGSVMSTPVAATVLINDVEVLSGQIGVGAPIDTPDTELFVVEYQGQDDAEETISVSISVTSGVAKIGITQVLDSSGNWAQASGAGYDGRQQILINGLPPEWPASELPFMPGGDETNPDWSGWCFDVSAGETITFEFAAIQYSGT